MNEKCVQQTVRAVMDAGSAVWELHVQVTCVWNDIRSPKVSRDLETGDRGIGDSELSFMVTNSGASELSRGHSWNHAGETCSVSVGLTCAGPNPDLLLRYSAGIKGLWETACFLLQTYA